MGSGPRIARTLFGPRPDDPVFVLVHGPEKVGKTHLACTFPPPIFFIDTEGRARKVIAKFPGKDIRHFVATTYAAVRAAVDKVLAGDHAGGTAAGGTIAIDSATDLYDYAVADRKDELGKAATEPVGLPIHWAPIQAKVREIVRAVRLSGRYHLVLTERVKPEYQGDKPTGRWLPRGYRDLGHFVDLHLSIWPTNGERECRVESNGYEARETSPKTLTEISWQGIEREILARAYAPAAGGAA